MSTQLERIAAKARADRKLCFTALAHHLTPEFLVETWGLMNRRGASGIDGETAREFEQDLNHRVIELVARLKAGRYQAPPVRRVEISKPGGQGTRTLGIPTAEDRLLQRAVARILEAIYEADFLEVSYGYRPGRSPHHALRALRDHIIGGRVNYVYEADIRGFFDHLNHEWLQRMLQLRIGDPVLLRLIGKWLRAGAMVNGVVVRTEEGVAQGGPISPVLANIYLHYALDLWFERVFKRRCRGEACLVRFADDYVACFQHRQEAEGFDVALVERLEKFHLTLAEGKTRLIVFGRFARETTERLGKIPGRFDFLGFTHVCGRDRKGRFAVIRIPSRKSCRRFLDRAQAWLMGHIHWKRPDQQKHLAMMLQGLYRYFSLAHSQAKLNWVRHEVELQWIRTLRRQGQRRRLRWDILCRSSWFVLPPVPRTLHPTV
ncbi:MAG TPA: group II intron reverse transcriptase/maturase [bacterium]|nr:group II intron reverse transcriptase/maturase [bacterium]